QRVIRVGARRGHGSDAVAALRVKPCDLAQAAVGQIVSTHLRGLAPVVVDVLDGRPHQLCALLDGRLTSTGHFPDPSASPPPVRSQYEHWWSLEDNEPTPHRKGHPLAPVLAEMIEAQIQVTPADRLPF